MITKAGVPANKVIVGVSSYGRSFGMVDPSCTGPECLFTGPDSGALPGECTDTAGYIADAEIYQYLQSGLEPWHDNSSDSDIAVYGNNTWVAYMNQATKNSRISFYGANNFGGPVEWAMDLEQFNDDAVSISVAQAMEDFTGALATSGYNMSSFDGNVTDLTTRLVRWDGCDPKQRTMIYSGWQQSWKIMNQLYNDAYYDFNFNEAAAVEYLGPPALNTDQQDAIKGPDTVAYTTNKDIDSGLARINFCPAYFLAEDLDTAMSNGNDGSLGVDWWTNLVNYLLNKARVWIHELLHIDWVSQGEGYGTNKHITDIKVSFTTNTGRVLLLDAYEPEIVKALARWGQNTSSLVIRNSDSLTLYAMARYVQKALGDVYPHLPLAPRPPDLVDPPGVFTVDGFFTIYENSSATVANSSDVLALEWDAQCPCAAVDDQDEDAKSGHRIGSHWWRVREFVRFPD